MVYIYSTSVKKFCSQSQGENAVVFIDWFKSRFPDLTDEDRDKSD